MKSPWTKKNPFLSLWLSGANAVAGAVRSRASAEIKRQTRQAMREGMRQAVQFWTGAPTSGSPRRKKSR